MCRLLGYLGQPISLDRLLNQPEHSLIVQSYQPREMTSGVVNADGFGIGWYHSTAETDPFIYKNILPIWSDINLPELSGYIQSGCILANIRSATAGQPVDLSNCQPFKHGRLLFTHNGFIENFRQTLYRPIRDRLNDTAYQLIQGSTDSEHIFALFIHHLQTRSNAHSPQQPANIAQITAALKDTIHSLNHLANSNPTKISANLIISNGRELVATRYSLGATPPTLYWLSHHNSFPHSAIIASEPLFIGDWHLCAPQSFLTITENMETHVLPI
ncbi:ergothioneine biosynthesis protein EgtC [Planktothricoides raciborskii]|uniref:Ergothioneine biosynthesis protein EgtC n=2 Tax=Planktothricoides raciborskii TaxID=132608 RepID=A0AAU8JJV4_9CYAN|nr:ergothioneine biosynthesis protein EgtC [Planktothricoides raciborskii]MBD2546946.1 ergothioneine biosynthesis protein EgtC [Planktothricoides raciborskii FACHB-1370]MBD2585871.1 ergothioneine biosynthesis protein EgtC [Planktothricoides raciborskii FACHB-1261]